MKKIMYMAVAAIAALSSCSSDEFAGSNGDNGDAKVFTATIEGDATSRSTYDATSKSAFWETTDIVSINGVKYQAQSGGAATTTFKKVTGETAADAEAPYYAFFADGANTGDGSYSATGKFTLPASYNYEAGKFNMPMYAYSASSTELGFKNLCGVLAITVPTAQMSTVSTITVTSDQQLNGAFTANEAGVLIFESKTLTGADKKITLTVATGGSGNVYYIPVPAGSHKLTVAVSDGSATKYMIKSAAVTIARNTKYSINFSGNHTVDYVEIGGLKWATMNLGASTVADSPETAFGTYYSWAATSTIVSSIDWTKLTAWGTFDSTNGITFSKTGGYTQANDPTYNGSSWTYSPATGTARSEGFDSYDAAKTVLGGSWRMPSADEFKALADACGGASSAKTSAYTESTITTGGIYWINPTKGSSVTIDGVAYSVPGRLFVATADVTKRVFCPAAGYINGTSLYYAGTYGCYWSSSLGNTSFAYYLYFFSNYVDPQDFHNRYYGFTVRPVSE